MSSTTDVIRNLNLTELAYMNNYPDALKFPFDWVAGGSSEVWSGNATLTTKHFSFSGRARIEVDTFPRPKWRFCIDPNKDVPMSLRWKQIIDGSSDGRSAKLETKGPFGTVNVSTDGTTERFSGDIHGGNHSDFSLVQSIVFGVINGHKVQGSKIKISNHAWDGRSNFVIERNAFTIDSIPHDATDSRSLYHPTHVIKIVLQESVSAADIEKLSSKIFWTLSLMKLGWVGILGPWLYDREGKLVAIDTGVTKTAKRNSGKTWCHESISDAFELLYDCLDKTLDNDMQREPMITAMHWLVESEMGTTSIEGSIILQQAALECLAWLEVVQKKGHCLYNEFDNLSAAKKFRRLLSLYNIDASIPPQCAELQSYADDYPNAELSFLTDLLAHFRNALVHANPKKMSQLFTRPKGDEERANLWYQIGCVVQQAVLASLGYDGQMIMRRSDAVYSSNAVEFVPWRTK